MDLKKLQNPPALYRPAPFWSWNDQLDKDELKRQIEEMAAKGWGSYFMHSRVGLVTGYLSQEWMEMIRSCAREAEKTGTFAWLYDEDKWPSGFAGGEVPEMSEDFRSRALVLLTKNEITPEDTVITALSRDDTEYFICKRISPLGSLWFNGASYVDLMNPEAVKAFINCTHERYREACGEYFGNAIPGIFTDEPCYLMTGHYTVPVLPWSDYLPAFFGKLKGYNLEEHLEHLFFDTGDYRKIRFDFFDSATKLFMESFTKQYYAWCQKNNLKMTGHFMAEDSLTTQTQWIGAAMPHYQFMHWPGIDKLGRHIEQLVTVKQLTSVVDQLDKERAFCEVFGCAGQQVSFYHRKWIADWEAALGISFVNHHLSLYSMRGERKRDYPANLFYQQPWWEDEKPFSDYIARVSYAVTQGKRKVDILVLHPVASVWSEYSPLHRQDGFLMENGVYNRSFEQLSKELAAQKLDFHYGDEIILEEHGKVENGKLVIGSCSYSTVIVPPCCTLRKNTVRLLEAFAETAGKERLLFMTPLPERTDGEKSDRTVIARSLKLSSLQQVINALDEYYKERIRITDRITGKNAGKVYCHVRAAEDGEFIFIANTDENREIPVTIRVPGAVCLKLVDLMSGEIYEAPASYEDNTAYVEATFYPAGSLLLWNPVKPAEGIKAPLFLDSGIAFGQGFDSKEIIRKWDAAILEDNVLPLNDVTLYINGNQVLNNQPVARAWHEHFYKAPNGTPFKAEYTFDALSVPDGPVFAAVEMAENLDRISFNGVEVKPLKARGEAGAFDKEKSWKDINFTKVPLDGLIREGKNTLVLEGRKVNNITGPGLHERVAAFKEHMPTEVETVYVVGDFLVTGLDRESFVMEKKHGAPESADFTSSGYPFYAGKVRFSAEITKTKALGPCFLKITDVEAACIELYVNGKQVCHKYWKPYVFDITDFLSDGSNKIEILAATTLFNVMGPNRISGIKDFKGVGPHTFINFEQYTAKYELQAFGIGYGVLME